MKAKSIFKKILSSEKGEGVITALYTMFILFIIFFLGIDIAGYTSTAWKLRNACNETLTLMKMENGFDSNTEQIFAKHIDTLGLDSSTVNVNGTSKYVQRGDTVTIHASTIYALKTLRPLGHELTFDINVEMSGLAHDFIR